MTHLHRYKATTHWVGNRGTGTSAYAAYSRNHDVSFAGKPILHCSSDPDFRGDPERYNPEELLVASLSGCHMLWYLHLCAVNGIIVTDYTDDAEGIMEELQDGSGHFTEVTLRPRVTVAAEHMIEKANALHHDANRMCFIAGSVKFPVRHAPTAVAAVPQKID